MMSYDVFQCYALATHESDKAVRVNAFNGAWTCTGLWVPRSLLHDDNEVNHAGDHGKLIVPLWWAVQENLEPRLSMPTSPLAVQKTVTQILTILGGYAEQFEGRSYFEDALCDCGECSDDVIGYHVAREIRTIHDKLRDAT